MRAATSGERTNPIRVRNLPRLALRHDQIFARHCSPGHIRRTRAFLAINAMTINDRQWATLQHISCPAAKASTNELHTASYPTPCHVIRANNGSSRRNPFSLPKDATSSGARGNLRVPTHRSAISIYEEHKSFGALHVFGVTRAQRARKGILLHIHPANENRANGQKNNNQGRPVAERQTETDERQQHASVGRMTHDTERASLDQLMVLCNCHIHGEKTTKRDDGPPAQDQSRDKQH